MPLTMSTSVAELLKKETIYAHKKSERILTQKLISITSYQDYASILKMFYGYFQPVEALVKKHLTKDVLNDINERRNSLFILQDLKAIDHSTDVLPICDDLPKINSCLEALGTMYVLEGSTLGGRMISKMLMKNTSVAFDNSNLIFFNGYKEDTGKRWAYFLSVIDQYEENAAVIVESANETFNCLTKWMERSL